jgi:hypothetical protein
MPAPKGIGDGAAGTSGAAVLLGTLDASRSMVAVGAPNAMAPPAGKGLPRE